MSPPVGPGRNPLKIPSSDNFFLFYWGKMFHICEEFSRRAVAGPATVKEDR